MAKILHITEALGGGIAYAVPLLMRCQAMAGHDLSLLYSRRVDTPSETDLDRLLPHPIKRKMFQMMREISPMQDVLSVWELRRIINKYRPDVVHLHSSKAGALGRLATVAMGRRARVFYSPHGLSFLREGVGRYGSGVYRVAEWALARLCGQLVAVSPSEKLAIEEALSLTGVKVLENAVELELVPRRVRCEGAPSRDGPIDVVTVGRVCDQKAPWRFAELAKQFVGRCRFTWVGDGDIRSQWLDGTTVEVTGWLSMEEARARVSMADIFVLLSQYEGLPIALVESQVSGLPAIVTDVVGNQDVVIPNRTGFRVKDVEGAARALQWLIDHPEQRYQIGAAAQKEASRRFDARTLAERSTQVYGLTEE